MNRFITVLIYLTCFLFVFGQLGRVHIPDQPIYFYLYEVGIVATLIIFIFRYSFKPISNIASKRLYVLFIAWMGLSLLISFFFYETAANIIAGLYALRIGAYMLYFAYLRYHMMHTPVKLNRPLIGMSAMIFVGSLLQYYLYPNIGNIAYLGWDPHISRMVGVFLDPPITAGLFFICGWYLVDQAEKTKHRSASISVLILSFLFIVMTYSRAAFLALLGTVILFGMLVKQYLLTALMVFSVILLIFLIPKAHTESINLLRTTSINARLADYQKGFEIWKKSPLLGIGYNHIRFEKEKYTSEVFVEDYNPSHGIASFHSSFMIILVTGGVIGLTLFIFVLLQLSRKGRFLLLSIAFLSILSLFDNVLLHPFILYLLGMTSVSEN